MGCDIHAFVEYKDPNGSWRGWGEEFRLGRHYEMFNAMAAGVRGEPEKSKFPPKGMPDDADYTASSQDRFFVIGDDEDKEDSRVAYRSDAESWVSRGLSKWVDEFYVTDPDHHSHSYLSLEDFEEVVNTQCGYKKDYEALIAAMKVLQGEFGESRIVFWFDN